MCSTLFGLYTVVINKPVLLCEKRIFIISEQFDGQVRASSIALLTL